MLRNYTLMREVLALSNGKRRVLEIDDFEKLEPRGKVKDELLRLKRDRLLEGAVDFDRDACIACEVTGLTDEGAEFFKLIENDGVWGIVLHTLKDADIDVPYPLLKEVCEEIVKRYVVSFIPEINPCK